MIRPPFGYLGLAVGITLLIATACSSGDTDKVAVPTAGKSELIALVGNSELAVGPNRVTVSLVGAENERLVEAPGQEVTLRVSLDGEAAEEYDTQFVWAIPDVTGFYVAKMDFPSAGEWELTALVRQDDSEQRSLPREFTVRETSFSPNIGDPVPRSENLTLDDVTAIHLVSTDPDPEPALYQMTVAEALDTGKPLVVTFATPAFCRTQFCGLVVENVKDAWSQFGDQVSFVHIEPFELDDEGGLLLITTEDGRPDLVPVSAILEWNLQTEPWVFVIDDAGRVAARFEGTASAEELIEAIDGLLNRSA